MSDDVRVLLGCRQEPREGWINVERYKPSCKSSDSVIVSNMGVGELENIVQAKEIVANEVMQFFRISDMPDVLTYWMSKLSQDGMMTIVLVDMRGMCDEYSRFGAISHKDFCNIIFGDTDDVSVMHRSFWDLTAVQNLVEHCGFVVDSFLFHKHKVIVKVKKQ